MHIEVLMLLDIFQFYQYLCNSAETVDFFFKPQDFLRNHHRLYVFSVLFTHSVGFNKLQNPTFNRNCYTSLIFTSSAICHSINQQEVYIWITSFVNVQVVRSADDIRFSYAAMCSARRRVSTAKVIRLPGSCNLIGPKSKIEKLKSDWSYILS